MRVRGKTDGNNRICELTMLTEREADYEVLLHYSKCDEAESAEWLARMFAARARRLRKRSTPTGKGS